MSYRTMQTTTAMIMFTLLISCDGGTMQDKVSSVKLIDVISADSLQKVSQLKIYFGHQSVGYNIIDGVADIVKENPQVALNIIETKDPAVFTTPVFAHSAIGQNTDVASKLKDFTTILEQGIGRKANVVFAKFCYVDITAETDVEQIYNRYKDAHTILKKKYPAITFVHMTVPLTSNQTDIKTLAKNMIKTIIGRPVRTYKDNVKRNLFNDMMRKEYQGREPLFDLADIESTLPNGQRMMTSKEGINFYSLAPEYTHDGGHLNEKGRKIVARNLLHFLAGLPVRK